MRRLFLLTLVAAAACGGPTAPTPAQTTPTMPAPAPPAASPTWTVMGTVTETLSGLAIPNVAVAMASATTVLTDGNGHFTISTQTEPSGAAQLTLTAGGYITRVTWAIPGTDPAPIAVSLIRDATPFSLGFYRQLARADTDYPGSLFELSRLDFAPKVTIQTVDATGHIVEPEVVALVSEWVGMGIHLWSNGRYDATISTSPGAPVETAGTIAVTFERDPNASYCGRAYVGANPGHIFYNIDRCACGSIKVSPFVVLHEVGHAMGFWHIPQGQGVMSPYYISDGCRPAAMSAAEVTHATIAYARPRGNEDPDTDPSSVATASRVSGPPRVWVID